MTTIASVNVATIQQGVNAMLNGAQALIDRDTLTIQNGEAIPESETACPWIGIYCIGVEYPARALGLGAGFRQQLTTFWMVCKEADPETGAKCTEKLESLVQDVMSALLSDPSLAGTVDTLGEIQVQYPQWGKSSGVYVQTAVIQFTAITNVTAGG